MYLGSTDFNVGIIVLTISKKIGIRMLHMATLEAKAVQNREIKMHMATTKTECILPAKESESPSILAIPLTRLPSAKAKPPPGKEYVTHPLKERKKNLNIILLAFAITSGLKRMELD